MRKIPMAAMLAFTVPVLIFLPPQQSYAQTPKRNIDHASCQNNLGGIFAEDTKGKRARLNTIDGTKLTSPMDLARLKGADRRALIVKGGDFSGWNLSGMKLHNLCFEEVNFTGSNWQKAKTSGLAFVNSNLANANMQNAKLTAVLLRNANLENTNMTGAKLRDGRYDAGWFESSNSGWKLINADMRNFEFDCGITVPDGCSLEREQMDMSGADLRGADIHRYTLTGKGAKLENAIVALRQVSQLRDHNVGGAIRLRGGDEIAKLTSVEVKILDAAIISSDDAKDTPSFDCSKAASKVENALCGHFSSELRLLDRQLMRSWRKALLALPSERPGLLKTQRAWLATRDKCISDTLNQQCMEDAYWRRIEQLERFHADGAAPLQPGQAAIYVSYPVNFERTFQEDSLFEKIKSVILADSYGEVGVKRAVDGSYSIYGGHVGTNAHICSIRANDLSLNSKTGWFTGAEKGENGVGVVETPAFQLAGNMLRVFKNGRADWKKYPNSYASCGARASFGRMNYVPMSQKDAAKRLEANKVF